MLFLVNYMQDDGVKYSFNIFSFIIHEYYF